MSYMFAPIGERASWTCELVGEQLAPRTKDDPRLLAFIERHGWLRR